MTLNEKKTNKKKSKVIMIECRLSYNALTKIIQNLDAKDDKLVKNNTSYKQYRWLIFSLWNGVVS